MGLALDYVNLPKYKIPYPYAVNLVDTVNCYTYTILA